MSTKLDQAQFGVGAVKREVDIAIFSPTSMSTQQYDTCISKLDAAGSGKPAGRLYHACFGTADKLAVFDVWDSQESFDRFGQVLMPILKEIGVDPGQP